MSHFVQVLAQMAGQHTSNAAKNRKEVAHHGLSLLLAIEISRSRWSTGNQQRHADPNLQAQQGESLMGR